MDRYYNDYVRFREYYNVMQQWVAMLQKKVSLPDYLKKYGFKNIAIYGMAEIGNCLVTELQGNNITLYPIDQGFPKLYSDIKCMKLSEFANITTKIDLIIVTLPHVFEEIKSEIVSDFKTESLIVSITEIIYNAYYDVDMGDLCVEY